MSERMAVSLPASADVADVSGWRQLLELNLGRRVTAEFLLGGSETAVKNGTLYAVQPEYFILTDDYGNYVAAGLSGLSFITFCPDCVPVDGGAELGSAQADISAPETTEENVQSTQPGKETPSDTHATLNAVSGRGASPISMAALNYAKRKARRLD